MIINVSKPYLPPLPEYYKYLEGIWDRTCLTNNGPLVTELEKRLEEYLEVKHVQVVTSGTVALQIAISALGLQGEIITTAFSHVSTTNSALLGNLKPVFIDIEEKSFCIDPGKIEEAVTSRTSAILATHVYGHPCDVKKIQAIADKYKLKVIYDGAHAFGVKAYNQSIFNYGDITTTSFHATKLYHTIEGGAIMTKDEKTAQKCMMLKNFGIKDAIPQIAGINGKHSEFHAAMGLCNLPQVNNFINKQSELSLLYRFLLRDLPLTFPDLSRDIRYNYAYFPVVFSLKEEMMRVKGELESEGIFARRYFYPSLNKLSYYKRYDCPVAEEISEKIMCLPLYYELSFDDVRRIAAVIINSYD